ncbi:hypothetical protein AVEN_238337-1 [Araneus ventricosus]|uniref:Integrase catalytic domain-containing protein n=1 Tax=Araneus ventricosus TaxID=182803 RepID=A0A4Y2KFY1_ARAVE|nr:hypothetical protein AVEN_238337-1 [Araneus ventricosus]
MANGLLERAHRTMKESLASMCESTFQWSEKLLFFKLYYNRSIHSVTKFAPAEIFFGRKQNLPLDSFVEPVTVENESKYLKNSRNNMCSIRNEFAKNEEQYFKNNAPLIKGRKVPNFNLGDKDKKTKQLVQQIEESNTKDHLAKATEELQKAIFAASRKAYKIKNFKLKINNNWWNQSLQIKKKELQALKRRNNKSEDDNKLKYQLQLSKKQAELKREAKKAKGNSFRNTCTKTTDPYGRPYKAVVKNKHPPAELFKQLGNPSSGDTKSFALKILQELYPPSHSPATPTNCFPLIQEPQIIKNEIRRILKKAPTKKAPGFDAIDYIVLKEVNNSFPEILHTFYNKCYQLHCFPEPLKKGIIVLFHKDGKEADKIKSYRPVTLLPTIGKVLEQILLRRLNHTLKKKNIQSKESQPVRFSRG